MRKTNGQIVLLTGQVKGTTNQGVNHSLREQFPKLFLLLDAAPVLAFSSVGIRNVCKRFGISEQTLDGCLNAYLRPGEPETEQARRDEDLQRVVTATPDMLDTISKAVAPRTQKRKRTDKKPASLGGAGQND